MKKDVSHSKAQTAQGRGGRGMEGRDRVGRQGCDEGGTHRIGDVRLSRRSISSVAFFRPWREHRGTADGTVLLPLQP